MALRVEMVTIDCRDPRALATWWARQLGGQVRAGFEEDFVVVTFPDGGVRLGFQQVEEPTPGKNRLHLDLASGDVEHEANRLMAEGALEVARVDVSGGSWIVLSDPEGNQFCVGQG